MATGKKAVAPTSGHALLRMLAFAIFGYLAARRFFSDVELLSVGAVAGALAGVFLLSPLRWLLWLANTKVREEHGYSGIRRAVGAGFATIVPFALLALAAELSFGWDALTAFAMSGFMAASGAAGLEVSRLGGKPILNLVFGAIHGLGLVAVWTLFMIAVQVYVAG
ncbi:MAG: hypothetical protein GY906_09730 [bacterium]|nr:hypothetical protein [bacterium]